MIGTPEPAAIGEASMTEQDGEAIIGPAKIPMTGSRGQPLKIAQYLAEGKRLADVVAAHRATKGEASAEGAPLTQTRTPVQDCNKPTKSKKSYPLPLLPGPTEIPGFPLNPSPPAEAPDYGNMSRVQAIRATQAEWRGKRAPLTPSGPSELRKRHDVRTWKVAE